MTTHRVMGTQTLAHLFAPRDAAGKPIHDIKEGDVVEDKGFFSTTASHSYAGEFNPNKITQGGWDGATKPDKTLTAGVRIPKGTKSVLHADKGESEVLLGPGTRFRVVKSGDNPVLEVVHPTTPLTHQPVKATAAAPQKIVPTTKATSQVTASEPVTKSIGGHDVTITPNHLIPGTHIVKVGSKHLGSISGAPESKLAEKLIKQMLKMSGL